MSAISLSVLLPLALTGLLSFSPAEPLAAAAQHEVESSPRAPAGVGAAASSGGAVAPQSPAGAASGPGAAFACFGSVHPYGVGTQGSGGFTPTLTTTGCPDSGSLLTVTLAKGLGGAPAQLAIGVAPLSTPFLGGTLLVDPLSMVPTTLSGPIGVPGAGSASFAFTIPGPSSAGTLLYVQAFVLDAGGPALGALTRGLSIVLG